MKRIISLVLLVVSLLSVLPFTGNAEENGLQKILFDDGSYFLISVETMDTRASGIKSGSKKFSYYSSSDELLWDVILRGTFSYSGVSSACESVTAQVTIYNSSWYEVSKTVSKSGSTAYCEAVLGYKLVGITMNKQSASISLTCDANGNLS